MNTVPFQQLMLFRLQPWIVVKRLSQCQCLPCLCSTAVLTGVSSLQNQRGGSEAGSGEAGSHAEAAALVHRWAEEGACRGALVDQDPDCAPANQHPGEERSCRSLLPWPAQAFPARATLQCHDLL